MTLGAEGMLLAENGAINKVIPTFAKEVFDVSGAEDTVIAALTLGLIGEQNFVHGKAEFVFMDERSGFVVQDEVLLERIHDSELSLAARLRKKIYTF